MNKLQNLEEIAAHLAELFKNNQNSSQIKIDVENKTSEELLYELNRLKSKTTEKVEYFHDKVKELEKIIEKKVNIDSFKTSISESKQIIDELESINRYIEQNKKEGEKIYDSYKKKLILETGSNNAQELEDKKDKLIKNRWELNNKFLGKYRFKNEIQKLDSKIDKLYDAIFSQDRTMYMDNINWHDKELYQRFQAEVFTKFSKKLLEQYYNLLQDVDKETGVEELSADVLESLCDDYIQKIKKEKISEKLESYKKENNSFYKDKIKVLSDESLVKKGLTILKEGLNQNHRVYNGDSKEDEKKANLLNKKLKLLPEPLQGIISYKMIDGVTTKNEEFKRIVKYIQKAPVKKNILNLFSIAREKLISGIPDERFGRNEIYLRDNINDYNPHNHFYDRKTGEESSPLYCGNIDMLNVILNNSKVKDTLGESTLKNFKNYFKNEVFEKLLVTQEQTNESIDLGYKAILFKDAKSIPYNILNFWREPGYSGEKPFLSIHSSIDDSLGIKYILSLDDNKVNEIKHLGIAGLEEIIKTVKENTDKLDDWENPIHKDIEEYLTNICSHYQKNGSDQEKYFTLGVISRLSFMQDEADINPKRDEFIELLSQNIGLDENETSNFKEYNSLFLELLSNIKRKSNDITTYLPKFKSLNNVIEISSEIIEKSDNKKYLELEQKRILKNVFDNGQIINKDYINSYFKILDEKSIIEGFNSFNINKKENIEKLALEAYDVNKGFLSPVLKEIIKKDFTIEQVDQLIKYIPRLKNASHFNEEYVKLMKENKKSRGSNLVELCQIGDDGINIISKVNNNSMELKSVFEIIDNLKLNNIKLTSYLVQELYNVDDKNQKIKSWKSVLKSFEDGNFDKDNELHRNLEYTRFREIVDHEKVKKHIKNHFTFSEYNSIFEKQENEYVLNESDKFEIQCVAYEAKLLKDYILKVNEKVKKIGKKVLVIPNISYGYLPVCPITDELSQEGIEFLIGSKVGSTECHYSKEVINKRLLKGYRSNIVNEQPLIIIVDGTKHLVARDDQDKAARYPDAYQGYLNQIIAINDSLGFKDIDYSSAGKNEEDMSRLRQTPEFQRLVDVYKHVMKPDTERERNPYQFDFWNTAEMDLIIRNYHKKIKTVKPFDLNNLKNPAMIFCNVGLLHEQIPEEIKKYFEGTIHQPAYFDDSKKIINFDFGFDNHGIKYLNRLENEVKKAYGIIQNNKQDEDSISALIKFNIKMEEISSQACCELV